MDDRKNILFESLLVIFPWLTAYLPLLAFLTPIIGGGELGVITLTFLFAHNLFNFIVILIFSFLGMLFIDSIWFFIGKSKIFNKVKNLKRISSDYSKLEKNIEKISKGRDLIILLIAKILVGTRIILILYISGRKNLTLRKFFLYSIASN